MQTTRQKVRLDSICRPDKKRKMIMIRMGWVPQRGKNLAPPNEGEEASSSLPEAAKQGPASKAEITCSPECSRSRSKSTRKKILPILYNKDVATGLTNKVE